MCSENLKNLFQNDLHNVFRSEAMFVSVRSVTLFPDGRRFPLTRRESVVYNNNNLTAQIGIYGGKLMFDYISHFRKYSEGVM